MFVCISDPTELKSGIMIQRNDNEPTYYFFSKASCLIWWEIKEKRKSHTSSSINKVQNYWILPNYATLKNLNLHVCYINKVKLACMLTMCIQSCKYALILLIPRYKVKFQDTEKWQWTNLLFLQQGILHNMVRNEIDVSISRRNKRDVSISSCGECFHQPQLQGWPGLIEWVCEMYNPAFFKQFLHYFLFCFSTTLF